jgi:hypothetical protein
MYIYILDKEGNPFIVLKKNTQKNNTLKTKHSNKKVLYIVSIYGQGTRALFFELFFVARQPRLLQAGHLEGGRGGGGGMSRCPMREFQADTSRHHKVSIHTYIHTYVTYIYM